ncbi:MAG: GMP synthase [Candidatus Odinarchaeum yellowstonii]|jgi:GMP synthase (glutamine-hydrolysing)|uniref:GMP synthase (glutamine-hydrolyzing) n=1 Tax=Odinarchaeota yellowstonii (strain LCB_4) TaxID=1841599 RepID=A0AAF0D1U5_ODILC|nr:MAG: GMP synthase [Candidatus Odinarchaeum yellowstonii]
MAFNEEKFVKKQIEELRRVLKDEKALIAVSGGVDSTTCAVLAHKALGDNLVCVTIDTGFMRTGEPQWVAALLSKPPLNLPMRIYDGVERFYSALRGLEDAEEKRKAFRETFYTILGEIAREESCRFLIQGTIAPDWIETRGGIKSQHNILTQIGINPVEKYGFQVVEPLMYLYKDQVRKVARYLQIPQVLSERQPFPGPGLLVRVVGRFNEEKIRVLKNATQLTEGRLAQFNTQQYFAAILDNVNINESMRDKIDELKRSAEEALQTAGLNVSVQVLKNKATGVKGDVRAYGHIAVLEVFKNGEVYIPPVKELVKLHVALVAKNPDFTRILYLVSDKRHGDYLIAIRAITTRDFMTASVADIQPNVLAELGSNIMRENVNVAAVYYDITQKPPATIEFE